MTPVLAPVGVGLKIHAAIRSFRAWGFHDPVVIACVCLVVATASHVLAIGVILTSRDHPFSIVLKNVIAR